MLMPRAPGRVLWACSGLLLPLLAGCQGAILGDWHLVQAIPNRQTFALDNVTFRSNNTFSATTTIEGVTNQEEGTYELDGLKLKLQPRNGGLRTYTISVHGGQLDLLNGKRKVVLEKGKRGH